MNLKPKTDKTGRKPGIVIFVRHLFHNVMALNLFYILKLFVSKAKILTFHRKTNRKCRHSFHRPDIPEYFWFFL